MLAHVRPVYANIDPLLDSEYLSYIYRGANTIYRVECDEVNTDVLANPHADIVIDNVNSADQRVGDNVVSEIRVVHEDSQ